MRMQSPPVNSLSLDFLTELCINVEKLEMDKGCRGLIITSVRHKFTIQSSLSALYYSTLKMTHFHLKMMHFHIVFIYIFISC